MAGERSRNGLVISALGAILLAISIFLPWYGLSFTATGIAFVQQTADHLASQYGNADLQAYVSGQHSMLSALAGHEFSALSAHQALRNLNILLLVLAGLTMLDALIPLARTSSPAAGGGGAAVVLLGALASLCVIYRMVHPPSPGGELVALSLREGAWMALAGSLAIVVGGLWPGRPAAIGSSSEAKLESAWTGLSGWTPQA